jgi:hypothetical protein
MGTGRREEWKDSRVGEVCSNCSRRSTPLFAVVGMFLGRCGILLANGKPISNNFRRLEVVTVYVVYVMASYTDMASHDYLILHLFVSLSKDLPADCMHAPANTTLTCSSSRYVGHPRKPHDNDNLEKLSIDTLTFMRQVDRNAIVFKLTGFLTILNKSIADNR